MIRFPNYQNDRIDRYALFKPQDFVGASVLDLGCNEGQVMSWAMSQGAKYTLGIDYDPAFSKPNIINADLDQLDPEIFGHQRFDVVLLLSVTHWVKDPVRLARLAEFLTTKVLYYEGHQQQHVRDNFATIFADSDLHWEKIGEVPVARPFYRGTRAF